MDQEGALHVNVQLPYLEVVRLSEEPSAVAAREDILERRNGLAAAPVAAQHLRLPERAAAGRPRGGPALAERDVDRVKDVAEVIDNLEPAATDRQTDSRRSTCESLSHEARHGGTAIAATNVALVER
jgi:hypothetical protein